MKVVAIANQKGGVGKTTTAVNLSTALARRKQRILMIDLDPQANATSGLGLEVEDGCSIYSVLLGEDTLDSKIVASRIENLAVIPSEMDLAGVEIELARMDNHLMKLQGILQEAKRRRPYDYCILDTPPSLGVLMTSALAAADEILIPLQCEWFGLEGLAKIMHVVAQIRESEVNPGVEVEGILMTMYDSRTNLSRNVVQEVKTYFPELLYRSVIPRTVRLGEAPSHGQTIFEWDPHGVGSDAYDSAAKEFLRRHEVRPASVAV